MNQSATSALFFRVIGRLPVHRHRQTPALVIDTNTSPLLDLVISDYFPSAATFIGNFPIDWSLLLHLPIYISLTPDAYQKIRVQKWCQQKLRGNKKGQVPGTSKKRKSETRGKNGQVSDSRIRGTRYPPKRKEKKI